MFNSSARRQQATVVAGGGTSATVAARFHVDASALKWLGSLGWKLGKCATSQPFRVLLMTFSAAATLSAQ